MKDDVSIKVKIADRIFPIKVSAQEEEHVRKAVKELDQKIKDIRNQYGVKDYKDILAMIALELSTDNIKFKTKQSVEDSGISDQIDELDSLLDSYTKS